MTSDERAARWHRDDLERAIRYLRELQDHYERESAAVAYTDFSPGKTANRIEAHLEDANG